MRLDHVSYVASHDQISDVVNRIGSQIGTAFVDGGIHPKFGTRNFTAPLLNGQYIEVVCPMDHPSTDVNPFGQAVKKKAESGGGWLTWVFNSVNLNQVEEKYAIKAVDGYRTKPDGSKLKWKQIGVSSMLYDPELPYYIKWESLNHPSQDGVANAEIHTITLSGDGSKLVNMPGVQELMDKRILIFTDSNIEFRNIQYGITSIEFITKNKKISIN